MVRKQEICSPQIPAEFLAGLTRVEIVLRDDKDSQSHPNLQIGVDPVNPWPVEIFVTLSTAIQNSNFEV